MSNFASMDETKRAFSLVYDFGALLLFYASWCVAVSLLGGTPLHPGAPFIAIKGFKLDWPVWFSWSTGGAFVVAALVFGFNPYRRAAGYGGAHFATEKEIRTKLKLRDKEGVILGKLRGQFLRTNEPLSTLIYAPPGSGKTAGIIIPSLLSCGNSALVHDPKDELHNKTAGFRAQNGQKIYRFEPAAENSQAAWNPLSKEELPSTWAGKVVHIDRIANGTVPPAGKDGKDDYWTREARSLFMFFALFLVHRDGETSLPDMREFAMSSPDPQGFVAELLDSSEDLPQRIIEEGNGILAKSANEFSGVFGTFKSFMNPYGDPFIAANTRRSDFRLRDLRKSDTTIYLVIRNSDQSRLRLFATLFFELATLALIHDEPIKGDKKVTFFLDEFVRLGCMREVLNMPAISRSFWVNVVFVAQSMSQVVEIYGQAGANQLRNTCSYHVIFAQNEQPIAKDISDSIGKKTRTKTSFSTPEKNLTRNTSESEEGVLLVLPQEVQSLGAFEILLLVQNHFQTPIKAKAPAWFVDGGMKARVGLPVPGDVLARVDTDDESAAAAPALPVVASLAPVAAVVLATDTPSQESASAPSPAPSAPAEPVLVAAAPAATSTTTITEEDDQDENPTLPPPEDSFTADEKNELLNFEV